MERACDLDFNNLLSFNFDTGNIFFGKNRTTLVNVRSLGEMRKELIFNLGMEEARRILTRFGWAWGYNDGLSFQNASWKDDIEWLIAGPLMHTLQGVVKVHVDSLEVNKTKKSFYLRGRWFNSYEAEQHLSDFGYHDIPVCWTLIGYASGWGSAYFGQKVIYREMQCIAKGDSCCTFEGKAISEWGNAISDELRYFEEEPIITNKVGLTDTGKDFRYRAALQAIHIMNTMTKLALEGQSIQQLSSILATFLTKPVIIQDADLKIIAKAPSSVTEEYPEMYKYLEQQTNKHIKSQPLQHLTLTNSQPTLGVMNRRIVAPINVAHRCMGYISLIDGNNDFSPLDYTVVEQISMVFAITMMGQSIAANIDERIRGDFLQHLIWGFDQHIQNDIEKATRFGFDLLGTFRIMIVEFDENLPTPDHVNDQEHSLILKQKCFENISHEVKQLFSQCLTSFEPNKGIFLIKDNGETLDTKYVKKVISDTVSKYYFKLTASISIGQAVNRIDNIFHSLEGAQDGLNILRSFDRKDFIISHEELGISRFLLRNQNYMELLSHRDYHISHLINYDERKGSELIDTLETFLANKCNNVETAKACNVTLSGLKYRLNKIEKIIGGSLNDAKLLLDIQLALLINRLVQPQKDSLPGVE